MVSAFPQLSIASRLPSFLIFFFARHIVSSFLLTYVAPHTMGSSLWFDSTPSIYKEINNSALRTTFHIPDDHRIRISSPFQRPHKPPEGFTTFLWSACRRSALPYPQVLRGGFSLLLHPLVAFVYQKRLLLPQVLRSQLLSFTLQDFYSFFILPPAPHPYDLPLFLLSKKE